MRAWITAAGLRSEDRSAHVVSSPYEDTRPLEDGMEREALEED